MTTTLTNDQITAGAAVLCDHGKPIGRNAAIEVFDAMQASGSAMADLDLDKLQQHATMFRDIESFHPGHFRTLKIFANSTLDLIARIERAAQPVAPVQDEWRNLCDQLIDIWDDGKFPEEHRTYVAGAWPDLLAEIRAKLAAPSPQIAEKVELPPLPEPFDHVGMADGSTRGVFNDEQYRKGQRDAIAASRRAPAPASAGQAPPAGWKIERANDEHYGPAFVIHAPDRSFAVIRSGAPDPTETTLYRYFAAQPAEVSAGQAEPTPEMIAAVKREWQNPAATFASLARAVLAAQSAEGSAGHAGQVATGDKPFAYVFKSTMKILRDGCSVMGEIHPEVEPGTDLFEPIYAAPVEQGQGAAQSEKAAAANAGGLLPCPFCGSENVALIHDTSSDHRYDWDFAVECECGAKGEADKSDEHAATVWNRRADRTPAADAGGQCPCPCPNVDIQNHNDGTASCVGICPPTARAAATSAGEQ